MTFIIASTGLLCSGIHCQLAINERLKSSFTVYWQNITQVNIFKCFCAIFYTFVVKYVTFREPVHELLSPVFVYILCESNRNQLSGLPSLPLLETLQNSVTA